MKKNLMKRSLLTTISIVICFLALTACSENNSESGRLFLFIAGAIAGFLVNRAIDKGEKVSIIGVISVLFTFSVFILAVVFIPDDAASALGIIATIIGVIILILWFRNTQ